MIIFRGEPGTISDSYHEGNDFYIIKGKKYKITAFHKKIIKYNRILSFTEIFIITYIAIHVLKCPYLLRLLLVALLSALLNIIYLLIYSFVRKEYK